MPYSDEYHQRLREGKDEHKKWKKVKKGDSRIGFVVLSEKATLKIDTLSSSTYNVSVAFGTILYTSFVTDVDTILKCKGKKSRIKVGITCIIVLN